MRRGQHSSTPPAVQKRKLDPPSTRQAEALRERLLGWYGAAHRDLPWRKLSDPYAIWVSEVMLQQTQVQTVIPYYRRWLSSFPTVAALANASEAEVMRHWQGLGYYSRARNLHKGAQALLAAGGKMPSDVRQLLELPGVGAYTAGAIASIALGQDEPAIDGNIERVLTRLFALAGDPKRAPLKAELWELGRRLLPHGQAGTFNQALMELGATCCTPKRPLCDGCPLRAQCRAKASGEPERYPQTAPRAKTTDVKTVAALAAQRGRVLMVELAPTAPRWGGLWVFPFAEQPAPGSVPSAAGDPLGAGAAAELAVRSYCGVDCRAGEKLHALTHHITRYRIELELRRVSISAGHKRATGHGAKVAWVSLDELHGLAMPAPHRKLARWLQSLDDALVFSKNPAQ